MALVSGSEIIIQDTPFVSLYSDVWHQIRRDVLLDVPGDVVKYCFGRII